MSNIIKSFPQNILYNKHFENLYYFTKQTNTMYLSNTHSDMNTLYACVITNNAYIY